MARAQKKLTKKELRQDPLMKSLAQAEGWFETNTRNLLIGAAAIVLIVVGIIAFRSMRSSANNEAMLSLAQARELISTDKKDEAITSLEDIASRFKGTRGGAEALYSLGEIKLSDNANEEAVKYFTDFQKKYKSESLLLLGAIGGEATALENMGKFQEAAAAYDKLYSSDKMGSVKPIARFNAGRCYKLAGDTAKARERFQEIIDQFKEATIKKDAEREIASLSLAG